MIILGQLSPLAEAKEAAEIMDRLETLRQICVNLRQSADKAPEIMDRPEAPARRDAQS